MTEHPAFGHNVLTVALGLDIDFHQVLSGEDSGWGGKRGHVHKRAVEDGLNPVDTVVYACGSKEMIASSRGLLTSLGLSSKHFFSDAFVSSN
jgi:CDP-4-dehydro-6-deoxyglucose reductase